MRSDGGARPAVLHTNARRLAGQRTGIETYAEQLLVALAARGDVAIEALTCAPLPGLERERLAVRLVPPALPTDGGRALTQLRKLAFDLWRCVPQGRRDAILFHGLDGMLPRTLRRGDRAVLTVHDVAFALHPDLFDRRTRLFYQAFFGTAVRRADAIVADSRATADDLRRLVGRLSVPIEVVHLGLDPFFTAPDDASGEARPAAEGDDAPFVLAVGGVSPRKNSRRLIEAFLLWRDGAAARRHVRLCVTGRSLDPTVARDGGRTLPPGVELLGYVTRERLRELYRRAAAFLYPSIHEGFGFPILEALAGGTPVLTSNTGSAPEIAGEAAVLVDPFDVTAIARGLELVLAPESAARARALGPTWAGRFTWARTAAATRDVYARVAP